MSVSGHASAVNVSTADSFYGYRPAAPDRSEQEANEPPDEASSGHSSSPSPFSYSILPAHVRNRSKAAVKSDSNQTPPAAKSDKSPVFIPIEKRTQSGPSWSQLPTPPVDREADINALPFSELPSHRREGTEQKSQSPNAANDADARRVNRNSLNLKRQLSTKSRYSGFQHQFEPAARISPFPIAPVISPIRKAAPASAPPSVPMPIDEQPAPGSLRALSISSSAQTDGFLTIPTQSQSESDAAPLIDPPLIHPPMNAIPNSLNHNQPAHTHSGWSDFGSAPVADNTLWWEPHVAQPLFPERPAMRLTLAGCLSLAQTQSPELQVLHSDWYIQQAEADRLAAAFDWNTFVEAIWNRDSAPVGSDLDGATNRLRSRTASGSFGVRRQTETGAQLEISQQFGTRSGNSIFLNPNPQANSRLAFDYEKPLLRGFGQDYNTSPQKLAMIERDTAYDRFRIGVQDYLLNVSSAYWTVVLQRGTYLQSKASLERVQKIADEMSARTEVDVTPGMLDRAKSEVATRKANLIQAKHDVFRSQEGLLRLIYGSEFHRYGNQEVVTMTLPMPKSVPVRPEDKVETALQQRSEVHQAIREIKAATIRYEVAANEVLPALNLVLSGYVAGLEADDAIGTAWGNQFTEGEPGVGIGFDFEVPYRNRAAEAAAERQQITIKRMQAALQTAIADVAQDVRNQVIERNKYGAMLDDQQEAIQRARSMMKNAAIRRENLADGNQVADLYLESLLQIQNRLESAESAYLQSQVRYTLADNALLRAIADIESIAGDAGQPPIPVPDNGMFNAPTSQPATSGYSFGQ